MVLNELGGKASRNLSNDDIGNQARYLLAEFVTDRMKADGLDHRAVIRDFTDSGSPPSPPDDQKEQIRNVASALKKIADDLDHDRSLQKMIQKVSLKNPEQTFSQVAREIFSDGIYNWGRVVTLFYFAYKLIVRAIARQVDIIKYIFQFVITFIKDHVAAWIIGRGGWGAIHEYFGATGYQVAVVLSAGIVLSVLVYWKCSRS